MPENDRPRRPGAAPEQDETEIDTGELELDDADGSDPNPQAAEAYHQRARLAEDRLEEVLGAYRRLKGENEQHRDRVARNIERRFSERRERLLLKFIDILDNLDRALEASERSFATEALIEGLILVRSQLLQTLQEEGLERIPVLGLPYNPEFSEAVQTRPVDDPEHHHLVVQELLRGYRFEGRVVRHSRVVVGEYTSGDEARAEPVPPGDTRIGTGETEPDAAATETAEPESDDSIEDIVSRVQAQEALFPSAFDADEEDQDPEGEPVEAGDDGDESATDEEPADPEHESGTPDDDEDAER